MFLKAPFCSSDATKAPSAYVAARRRTAQSPKQTDAAPNLV